MIYTEKGYGLHQRIAEAGYTLVQAEENWVASDPVAVQAIIDGYTLDDARAPIIANVKALAKEKILAFLPDWKQSNYNARMNELNMIRFSRAWSEQEAAEVTFLQSEWGLAKAIRAASNAHEVNLKALQTFQAVLEYDISIGWPEA